MGGKAVRQSSAKFPFWRRSAAASVILAVSAVADIAYLSIIARTPDEILWSWSILLFILTLAAYGMRSWPRTKKQANSRALRVAARLSFNATSTLVVASTAYRFEGAEAALFTGLVWFVLIIFAPLFEV